MNRLIILFVLLAGIGTGLWAWGEREYRRGAEATRTAYEDQLMRQRAKAEAKLNAETARANTAETTLKTFKTAQEKTDAERLQTIADLSGRLRAGQLRDPYAKAVCGGGCGGSQAGDPAGAGPGAENRAEATGVLSPEFSGLLLDWFSEADTINAAYASCRADSASLRATLSAWAAPAADYTFPKAKLGTP